MRPPYLYVTKGEETIGFQRIPKCGGSTAHLYLSLAAGAITEERLIELADYYNLSETTRPTIPTEWAREVSSDRTPRGESFVFLRHPVERFVSGFLNRVLHHQKIPLDLPTFLDRFESLRRGNGDIGHHFRPQYDIIGDPERYSHVLPLKSGLEAFRRTLQDRFDLNIPTIRTQSTRHLRQSFTPTKELLDLVEKHYAKDLDLYLRFCS